MRDLYEITAEYQLLTDLLDDPEADEESIIAAWNNINDELETKADNYARIIRNLESQLEGIKVEQQRLTNRKQQVEKNIEWLKMTLYSVMKETGKTKFKTDLFSFGIQKNGGVLPVIVDEEIDKLPENMIIVSKKPDLKAISDYIKETGDVTFAHFGERGESLRIK